MSGCCRGLPAKVCIARPYGCAAEPPATPCVDEVDQIARWLVDNRKLDGRTYYAMAQELLTALAPLRQAERERLDAQAAEIARLTAERGRDA